MIRPTFEGRFSCREHSAPGRDGRLVAKATGSEFRDVAVRAGFESGVG